jgi:hypothetical protein
MASIYLQVVTVIELIWNLELKCKGKRLRVGRWVNGFQIPTDQNRLIFKSPCMKVMTFTFWNLVSASIYKHIQWSCKIQTGRRRDHQYCFVLYVSGTEYNLGASIRDRCSMHLHVPKSREIQPICVHLHNSIYIQMVGCSYNCVFVLWTVLGFNQAILSSDKLGEL